MNKRHETRRGALLALFQFDAGRLDDMEDVAAGLAAADVPESLIEHALDIAKQAWETRSVGDAAVTTLAPEWPVHRQPHVDRSLLRLAIWELRTQHAPPKVVIDEAVELAHEFSTKESGAFVNGVLDRYWHQMVGSETSASTQNDGVE